MHFLQNEIDSIHQQIAVSKSHLQDLRSKLKDLEAQQVLEPPLVNSGRLTYGTPDDFRAEVFAALEYEFEPEVKVHLQEREYLRHERQVKIPQVGISGQLALKAASVLVIGLSGTGCSAASYLAGAGIGTLGLVDDSKVNLNEIYGQPLQTSSQNGLGKVYSAIANLSSVNDNVTYVPHLTKVTNDNAVQTIESYDIVLDCTNDLESQCIISDTCVDLGKPLICMCIRDAEGIAVLLNSPPRPKGDIYGGPCYRCIRSQTSLFGKHKDTDNGVFGPANGMMGVFQALLAIKVIIAGARRDAILPVMLRMSAFSEVPFFTERIGLRDPVCPGCAIETSRI